jgi:HSP20 family protein
MRYSGCGKSGTAGELLFVTRITFHPDQLLSEEVATMFIRFHRAPAFAAAPRSVFNLDREIGDVFDSFFGAPAGTPDFLPAMDLAEQAGESVLVAELPGVKREDLKIALQNGVLTLSAERKETTLPAEARWIRNEIPAGRFSRSVTVPHDVDADRVTAELKDGILRVVLPKAASAHPKEIKVQ